MAEALLTISEVIKRTGHSKRGLYLAIAAGTYPAPRKRGARSLWVASEIDAAIKRELKTLPVVGQSAGKLRKSSVTRARAAA